jgi:2-polyprenyl-6-methoxyphenol hydroxylase-like FAD-dependent oxidoreductase
VNVVVSGAGIAGLAVAHLLDTHGCDVTVVEQSPERRRGGYMIDFFGPGFDAAHAMHLLPRLRELSYAIDAAEYVDGTGHVVARIDYRRLARTLEGRLLSLMRGDLELSLWEQLGDAVDVRFGCTIEAIDQNQHGALVALSDGTTRDADLVVGADGIHSRVRELAFGSEARFRRYLGMHTAAFEFADAELSREFAGRFVLTDTVDRQIGCYGIRAQHVAVFAVHRSPEAAFPSDPKDEITHRFGDLGFVVPALLEHCPEPPALYYDIVAQIEMPHWSKERVVLVGDACQAVSLLAGQGASLALAGACVLAEELARASNVCDALDRYEARMRPVVVDTQAAGRRTADWFVPPSHTRLAVRRVALRLAHAPGFDRLLARALVGQTTAIPPSPPG